MGGHAHAAEPASVLIVLDVSGSMGRTDAAGTQLLSGAKAAVRTVVEDLPAGTRVGLRAYGHTYAGDDPAVGCADSALLTPVAAANTNTINAALDGLQPTGFTPIRLALEQGVNDLPAQGQRTIIVISDGEDTCSPPEPCEVAERLSAQGVDVTVESVGLLLENEEAREQLVCLSDATGGTYRDAATVEELSESLVALSTRAARTVSTGDAVEGTPSPADAPTVREGVSSDTIVVPETLHYGLTLEPGQEATVTATVGPLDLPGESAYRAVALRVAPETGTGGAETYFGVQTLSDQPASVSVSVDDVRAETAGRLIIRVESQSRERPAEVAYDLQLTIETTAPPPSPSPSPSSTPSPSTTGAPAATNCSGPASSTSGEESKWPTWAMVAVAGVGIAGAGVGGWLLARSRPRSAPGPR